jgi:hypothetical protein
MSILTHAEAVVNLDHPQLPHLDPLAPSEFNFGEITGVIPDLPEGENTDGKIRDDVLTLPKVEPLEEMWIRFQVRPEPRQTRDAYRRLWPRATAKQLAVVSAIGEAVREHRHISTRSIAESWMVSRRLAHEVVHRLQELQLLSISGGAWKQVPIMSEDGKIRPQRECLRYELLWHPAIVPHSGDTRFYAEVRRSLKRGVSEEVLGPLVRNRDLKGIKDSWMTSRTPVGGAIEGTPILEIKTTPEKAPKPHQIEAGGSESQSLSSLNLSSLRSEREGKRLKTYKELSEVDLQMVCSAERLKDVRSPIGLVRKLQEHQTSHISPAHQADIWDRAVGETIVDGRQAGGVGSEAAVAISTYRRLVDEHVERGPENPVIDLFGPRDAEEAPRASTGLSGGLRRLTERPRPSLAEMLSQIKPKEAPVKESLTTDVYVEESLKTIEELGDEWGIWVDATKRGRNSWLLDHPEIQAVLAAKRR